MVKGAALDCGCELSPMGVVTEDSHRGEAGCLLSLWAELRLWSIRIHIRGMDGKCLSRAIGNCGSLAGTAHLAAAEFTTEFCDLGKGGHAKSNLGLAGASEPRQASPVRGGSQSSL